MGQVSGELGVGTSLLFGELCPCMPSYSAWCVMGPLVGFSSISKWVWGFFKFTISALYLGVCEIFCAPFKSVISVSDKLPGLSWNPVWPIKPNVWWLIFPVQESWSGESNVGFWPLTYWRESLQLWFWFDYRRVCVLTILHFCPFYFHCCGYFFVSLVVENLFC